VTDTSHLRLTTHARNTMADRGVSLEKVYEAITDPAVIEPDNRGDSRCRYVGHEGLVVVCAMEGPDQPGAVITVLLREQAQWNDDDARKRFEGD
jgi:hypothetical protein